MGSAKKIYISIRNKIDKVESFVRENEKKKKSRVIFDQFADEI